MGRAILGVHTVVFPSHSTVHGWGILCIFISHMIGLKLERVLAPEETFEEQPNSGRKP
jgi:hypothetical protein